jgi:hypothetical protein
MSSDNIRQQNEGIVDWLRRLSSRLDRLEKGDKGVRINDTRIGDMVLSSNSNTNQIEARNLNTGDITPITSFRETVFSWPGAVALGVSTEFNESPMECVPDTTVAHELVLTRSMSGENPLLGAVTVQFVFGKTTFRNGLTVTMGLPSGSHIRVRPVNIPVYKNDLVFVRLTCLETYATNLTATIRYGQPTEQADNGTVDAFCPV